MYLSLTTEQQLLKDSASRFVEAEHDFQSRRAFLDAYPAALSRHWRTYSELGWLGIGLDEDLGGMGGNAIECGLILEQFGRGLMLAPLAAHLMAVQVLAKANCLAAGVLLEKMVAGESRLVLAHIERQGWADEAATLHTCVERRAQEFCLSGGKALVLGGADADAFLISANWEGELYLFMLPADAPGLRRRSYRLLDNQRVADLEFDKVWVGEDDVVARGSHAAAIVDRALDFGLLLCCAQALGAMDAALWITRDYLKSRNQFGVAIGSFQALQHRMADMLIETELSRSMLYQGLAALEEPEPSQRRAGVSATKVQFSMSGLFVGRQGIQLHGGMGMTEECTIGHYYKHLYVIANLMGNADLHLQRFMDNADNPIQHHPNSQGERE